MLNNVNFDKLIIDTIDSVTMFDKADGTLTFIMDQLKDGSFENGSETVYGTGKAGVRLSAFNRSKTAKFSCNNGYIIASALAAQVGSDVEAASASNKFAVPYIEYIKVLDPVKVTITSKPVGIVGKEIPFIYKANSDNTQGVKFPIGVAASATEFKYDPDTQEITLPTGIFTVNDVVIIPYDREVTVGKKILNSGEKFSRSGKVVIDCTSCDICDQNIKYHTVIVFDNAKVDGNFSMAFGTDPVAHAFSCEALLDPCSIDKTLWTWYVA